MNEETPYRDQDYCDDSPHIVINEDSKEYQHDMLDKQDDKIDDVIEYLAVFYDRICLQEDTKEAIRHATNLKESCENLIQVLKETIKIENWDLTKSPADLEYEFDHE